MHQGHDHNHGNGAGGHNRVASPRAAQWQTPHLPAGHTPDDSHPHHEPDLDLVEKAFVESFTISSDQTSFLRLARVPFEATDASGRRLVLLRVETDGVTDVGSVTPQLGGGAVRYDPLPAKMVSQRRRLRFVYFDGAGPHALTLGEVRELTPA